MHISHACSTACARAWACAWQCAWLCVACACMCAWHVRMACAWHERMACAICDRIRRCIVRAWRARLQHERHGEGGEGGAVRRGRRDGGELDVARIDEADAHVQCSGCRQQSDEVWLGRPRARAPEETERHRVHHQPNQSRLPSPQLEQHAGRAAFCSGVVQALLRPARGVETHYTYTPSNERTNEYWTRTHRTRHRPDRLTTNST